MPTVELRVLSPTAGAEVDEQNLLVSGDFVFSQDDTDSGIYSPRLEWAWVTFGAGGPRVQARITSWYTWECVGSVGAGLASGQPFTLTVDAMLSVHEQRGGGQNEPPDHYDYEWEAQGSVNVSAKQKPPRLSVAFASPVVTATLPYPFKFSGTASNDYSGMTAVRFRIDNGPFSDVDNPNGDWSVWSKTVELEAGSFQLTVEATGGGPHQLKTTSVNTIDIRTPFEPTDVDQVFANTTYLRELIDFAARQIRIGTGRGPSAQVLASRFFQPYDKLTLPPAFEQATQPIRQARIAIEVLRRMLNPPPPVEIEERFRFSAYQALLRELGTSYDELRLARLANQPDRQALAARLGFSLEASRPDRLDRITLTPETVNDALLEEVFGFLPTRPDDALEPPTVEPQLPLWRASTLKERWLADDARSRDGADGYAPIIDPDLIDQAHIKRHTASNPAYSLWTDRQAWIAATRTAIAREGAEQTEPLTRFDQVVGQFIGTIDLQALGDRDAQGEDLSAELGQYALDSAAFRFLVRSRALLAASTLLESEWQDLFDIALQVQKRRRFQQWRTEERQSSLILEPGIFAAGDSEPATPIPDWRGSRLALSQWRHTLLARARQWDSLETGYRAVLAGVEAQTLPELRDALLDVIGQRQTPPEAADATAERLSRELSIDFRAHSNTQTTRVDQAIETLQGALFGVRTGRLAAAGDGVWSLNEASFDAEWPWMGSYRTWLAAIQVFAYPENQLFPNLYVHDGHFLKPTAAFMGAEGLIAKLRKAAKLTPELARTFAADYLASLRTEVAEARAKLPADFVLTDKQMSEEESEQRRALIASLFKDYSNPPTATTDPAAIPQYLHEIFWLVPMALAMRLQDEREYLVALDWYQTVYAFDSPVAKRKRYPGLTMEAGIPTSYSRTPVWLTEELNPHIVALTSLEGQLLVGRKHVYTRFTVMSIVRCFLAYADMEFSRNLAESVTKARTLYETAIDLLGMPELEPETGDEIPFPANPVWTSLLLHARANLAKIQHGLNIAGMRATLPSSDQAAAFLPSQYRYAFLVERAKNLVGVAQQVEATFLAVLEKRDSENYTLNEARHGVQVAGTSVNLADLKVADAGILGREAELQKEKAEAQFSNYSDLINDGLNKWETRTLAAMRAAVAGRLASLLFSYTPTNLIEFGNTAGKAADLASATAQLTQLQASFERRREEWRLQQNLAGKDMQISRQQILHARNQQQVANEERQLAGLQQRHAEAVLDFLSNKFTSAELFDWMSGVLGGVYAYFLQQATALAQLAEAQLAFERQEPAPGIVRADYWTDRVDLNTTTQPDRRGLTGSAQLMADVFRLDQYAFDTDRRKLHLTQTLSLAQIGAQELHRFRETGLLTFATPETLFDREFPGHYLRLLKRVKVSLIALVPPTRGVRASLSASGLSRTVVAGDDFKTVTLSHPPETIAFTSPLNATGLFELEQENGMLLPFEGMGLDTVWRLELPKPANPFDYRTIADVLLTLEYTALHSYDYRQKVVRELDRSASVDCTFSLRDQFPDAWYDLNNPDQVNAERRMRVEMTVRRERFPVHLDNLSTAEISLFCVRDDSYLQELHIVSLEHAIAGADTVTGGEVVTRGGIVGTRRPGGAPWQALIGRNPVGEWRLQLEDTEPLRKALREGLIQDLVLVLTIDGITPAWPA